MKVKKIRNQTLMNSLDLTKNKITFGSLIFCHCGLISQWQILPFRFAIWGDCTILEVVVSLKLRCDILVKRKC